MNQEEPDKDPSGQRIYIRVLTYIKQLLIENKLSSGDRIPTERVLAEALSASRNSIREALKIMENMGMIESRQGSGNYLCANIGKSFTESLSMLLLTKQADYIQLSQLRRALEVQAFTLSVSKITDEQINALDSLVKRMDLYSLSEQTKTDKEFHDIFIQASGNMLIAQIMQALSDICRDFINLVLLTASEEERTVLLESHRTIFESLKEKNTFKGIGAIHAHYDLIDKLLEKSI